MTQQTQMTADEARQILHSMYEQNLGAVLRYGRWWFPVHLRAVIWPPKSA